MKRQYFWCLGIFLAVLPLGAQEIEREIAGVYLREAVSTRDADTSRLLIQKALEFDPASSDALYWSALLGQDNPADRLPLLKRANLMNSWVLVRPHQGLALYLESLASTRQFGELLREVSGIRSSLERSPDLLYPYILALKAKGETARLESAIGTAWLLYQSDARFWSFFLEREAYFLPFFDYLKQIQYFPTEVLHSLLGSLPADEAQRQALLLMLQDKSENDLTLTLYLSLNGLIAQDEALYLLKARGDVWDLNLHKRFFESLQDPLLRTEYEEWLAGVTGSFYWTNNGDQDVNNWVNIVGGSLVNWTYVNAKGGRDTIHFRDSQPVSFSSAGNTTVEYGIYPYVLSISTKDGGEEKISRLGTGLLSLPLVQSTYLSADTIPLFLPLETDLISYNLQESFWMPYTTKLEVYSGDNLVSESDYLHGRPLKRSFVNPITGKFDRWDFYDNGILTSVQRDLNGDGYPEVLMIYTAENQGLYTLLDNTQNGQTDFLYYQDAKGIVEYWDWFNQGEMDTILIKPAGNARNRLIPLDSPEASEWRNYPKFTLREW